MTGDAIGKMALTFANWLAEQGVTVEISQPEMGSRYTVLAVVLPGDEAVFDVTVTESSST